MNRKYSCNSLYPSSTIYNQNISSNISITEKYLPVIIYEASDTNRPLLADSKVKSLDLPASPPGGYAFWRQSTSSVQVSARSIIKIS